MIRAIADTHALIWYLFEDRRLSRAAKQFMDNAAKSGEEIGFSAIGKFKTIW